MKLPQDTAPCFDKTRFYLYFLYQFGLSNAKPLRQQFVNLFKNIYLNKTHPNSDFISKPTI
jgi:hypothetical protein